MAKKKAIDKKPSFEEEAAAGEFSYFALEDKEDNRLALYSYIGAVIGPISYSLVNPLCF